VVGRCRDPNSILPPLAGGGSRGAPVSAIARIAPNTPNRTPETPPTQAPMVGGSAPRSARAQAPLATRAGTRAVAAAAMKVLIVNCKGGGHGSIGLFLARALMAAGHQVTILNDGEQGKLEGKAPFSQYASLAAKGAEIVWGSPTDPSAYPAGDFDVVYDNNGKDIDTCKPLIDTYAAKVKHYVYVSSAGMYKADPGQPMSLEGDKRAEKNHYFVEEYLKEVGAPFTIFRPLYIYGEHTAKDYHQWMMDRVLRDRPVCIPGSGQQCTSMTNVEDVASMLALVPGNAKAVGEAFNVCSDRVITFDGMAKAIAQAAGKELKVVKYDPEAKVIGPHARPLARTPARTHALPHARTLARTHARTHRTPDAPSPVRDLAGPGQGGQGGGLPLPGHPLLRRPLQGEARARVEAQARLPVGRPGPPRAVQGRGAPGQGARLLPRRQDPRLMRRGAGVLLEVALERVYE